MKNILKTKKVRIVVGSIIGVALLAAATMLILNRTEQSSPGETGESASSQPSVEPKVYVEKGMKLESNGDTKQALAEYQSAYDEYKKSNDTNGTLSMEMKVNYMKKILEQESSQDTDPSKVIKSTNPLQ